MNRPFSAFGALMALLALSMFAVSSTSRSTTVQPPRLGAAAVRPSQAAKYVTAFSSSCLQCPDSEESRSESADDALCPADSFAGCCDAMDAAALEGNEQCASLRGCNSAPCSRLFAARVEVAETTQLTWRFEPTPVDCRSHYDPVYDRLIYGVADEDLQPAGIPERAIHDTSTIDRDWMAVFQSFIAPESLNRPSLASTRGSWTTSILGITLVHRTVAFDLAPIRMRILSRAFRRWLEYQITRFSDDARITTAHAVVPIATAMAWAEFAELIDRASRQALANVGAVTTSGAGGSVRSSGWLRHSAASSLYQLGLLFQAAGREIEPGTVRADSQSSE